MNSQALKKRVKTVELFAEIEDDLLRVETAIEEALVAKDPLLVEVSTHLLRAGGKRIRPAMVLLAGRFNHYDLVLLLPVAAAVELIHMATLVHDDVVDRSRVRRGLPTVNAKWGSPVSVLIGDYLFAKAFSILAQTGDNRLVRLMADVVYQMSTGEIQQINSCFKVDQTEEDYFDRIAKKTAIFIAESCRLGAIVSGASPEQEQALYDYGFGLGMGFQIIDDILDFTANVRQLGKPIGSDVRSGVLTLPVLHALAKSPRRDRLREILGKRPVGEAEVRAVGEILSETESLQYAYRAAVRYVEGAKGRLTCFPAGAAQENLLSVADFVVNREF